MKKRSNLFGALLFLLGDFGLRLAFAQNPYDARIEAKKQEILELEARLHALREEVGRLRLGWIQYELRRLGLPQTPDSGYTVVHTAMVLNYKEKFEQACWVAHIIVPEVAMGKQSRTNNFRADPLVPTGTAHASDYRKSGFERGHLAPSADFRWNITALDESYYYSNIAPQRKELNRERWRELEELLRQYVIQTQRPLYVVTGGILKGSLLSIGPNEVAVPKFFYKVALDFTHPQMPGIGFILPNSTCSRPLMDYRLPIDSVESRTGINFFPKLTPSQEKLSESVVYDSLWLPEHLKQFKAPLEPNEIPAGAITPDQARQRLHQTATVCGTVAGSAFVSRSGNILINLDKPYPENDFTLVISKKDIPSFPYDPVKTLKDDTRLCANGKITEYRGRMEIIVNHPHQLQLFGKSEE
ncbi:MAG: DNA/RNA non-specific endonuclease [Flavobacteriales bacterium]|nr:DNA/RNA non-specific endonuclease [Flavobacteriales bacterium]MCX7767780.1 DNA/RNA non-specific endonuclease [Flavobacteriales bacterium]MDW8410625.1 DNA/RNA non-specific endonuclease [Flavobacteriales bacterium]